MPKFSFRVIRDRGAASILTLDLPNRAAAKAKAEELAHILLDEARRMRRLIDFDVMRVSDESGKVVLAEPIVELAPPQQVSQSVDA